ncbi:MAG: hypothetical protein ABI707_17805, partial [Ferruginibacter sp.]
MRKLLPGSPAGAKLFTVSFFKSFNEQWKSFLLVLLLVMFGTGIFAQQSFFKRVSGGNQAARGIKSQTVKNPAFLQLDEKGLRSYLLPAPMEFKGTGKALPLDIPLPDGTTETFLIVESPVLS